MLENCEPCRDLSDIMYRIKEELMLNYSADEQNRILLGVKESLLCHYNDNYEKRVEEMKFFENCIKTFS